MNESAELENTDLPDRPANQGRRRFLVNAGKAALGTVALAAFGTGKAKELNNKEIEERPSELWGKFANSELPNDCTRSAFFFAGPPNPDSKLQNLDPLTEWNENNIPEIFDEFNSIGINAIDLSWWGFKDENKKFSPTECTDEVISRTFAECEKRNILVAPVIEVSDDFKFWQDFPDNTKDFEDRIEYLVKKFGGNKNWQQMFDRDGNARHVIKLIETIHRGDVKPSDFAQKFDEVANTIQDRTGVKIGFVIDPTPLPPNKFEEKPEFEEVKIPDPESLKNTKSILAINPYNIFSDDSSEDERLVSAEKTLQLWKNSGIPLIVPLMSGFDDTHFRSPGQKFGYNTSWYERVGELARKYQTAGIRFDNWNATTEGSAVVPTKEYGDDNYNWAKTLLQDPGVNPALRLNKIIIANVASD